MSISLKDLTIETAVNSIKAREYSIEDLTEIYLENIKSKNSNINAYLEVFDDAVERARELDKRLDGGADTGPLYGIPFSIKDNILVSGKSAQAGSKILDGYKASYDATVIKRLRDAGAIFLGRTNMDEFAMGSSTENSGFSVTCNPHDLSRVPGGSSGGSAAAVSSFMSLASLGSDTGGSIRQPASFCGVVGLLPTYGSVSRFGLIALASSLDQIGPVTRTVSCAETIFKVIRGSDEMDSTTLWRDREAVSKKDKIKIGVPRHLFSEGVDDEVLLNFNESVEKLEKLGYEINEVELPNIKYSLPVYYIIMPAEASSNLARYDGVKYGLSLEGDTLLDGYFKTRGSGFGREVRRRIMLGTYVLSAGYYDAYYRRAGDVRRLIRSDFERVFREYDCLLTPTSPTPPFKIGERLGDPIKMYLSDTFTASVNLAGLPALSVPSGFVKIAGMDLPLGLQIIAPAFREDILFEVGKKFYA